MKRLFVFIGLLLCIVSFSQAKKVKLNIDFASFKTMDSKTNWELYYSFPDTLMSFAKFDDVFWRGEIKFALSISSQIKEEISDSWSAERYLENPNFYHQINLTGKKSYLLFPGQYTAELKIWDNYDSTTSHILKFNFSVKQFDEISPSTSDLILASSITKATTDTSSLEFDFKKNSFTVIPNAALEYYGIGSYIPLYYELYNFNRITDSTEIIIYILDGAKRKINEYRKKLIINQNTYIDFANLPNDSLATGVYYLRIECFDKKEVKLTSIEKKFFILNTLKPDLSIGFNESQSFETSEWAIMSEEQVDLEFKYIEIKLNNNEKKTFNLLSDVKAKQKFLYSYWRLKDTDTIPFINTELDNFRELVRYANNFYSFGNKTNGWNSDRGRILLKYGKPNQVEYHPSEGTNRAYEEWIYTSNNNIGAQFFFVDVRGDTRFRLVHSTRMEDAYNPNWFKQYVPIMHDAEEDQNNSNNQNNR